MSILPIVIAIDLTAADADYGIYGDFDTTKSVLAALKDEEERNIIAEIEASFLYDPKEMIKRAAGSVVRADIESFRITEPINGLSNNKTIKLEKTDALESSTETAVELSSVNNEDEAENEIKAENEDEDEIDIKKGKEIEEDVDELELMEKDGRQEPEENPKDTDEKQEKSEEQKDDSEEQEEPQELEKDSNEQMENEEEKENEGTNSTEKVPSTQQLEQIEPVEIEIDSVLEDGKSPFEAYFNELKESFKEYEKSQKGHHPSKFHYGNHDHDYPPRTYGTRTYFKSNIHKHHYNPSPYHHGYYHHHCPPYQCNPYHSHPHYPTPYHHYGNPYHRPAPYYHHRNPYHHLRSHDHYYHNLHARHGIPNHHYGRSRALNGPNHQEESKNTDIETFQYPNDFLYWK